MGRKKPPAGKSAEDRRVTVLNLKGPPELRDWLSALSDKTMIPASAIARAALIEWAERHGHKGPKNDAAKS